MKIYFSIIGLIILLVASLGFVLPYLLSSDNTEFVLLGLLLAIFEVPLCYSIVKSILNQVNK